MKKLTSLVLIFLLVLIIPSVKASEANAEEFQPVYEIVNLNIDLILNDCNKTWIYWEKELPINVIPGGNDPEIKEAWAKYIEEVNKVGRKHDGSLDEYMFHHETIIKAKYGVLSFEITKYFTEEKYWELHVNKVLKKYLYFENKTRIENGQKIEAYLITGSKVEKEVIPAFDEAFKRIKKEAGILIGYFLISDPRRDEISPLIAAIFIYELNEEKVKILNEYLFPIAKKYEIILVYLDSITYREIEEKQNELILDFYIKGGLKEYYELVKSYYGVDLSGKNIAIPPVDHGSVSLPIPENATFNKEFVLEATKLVRKYIGCSVPLEIDFAHYGKLELLAGKGGVDILPIRGPDYFYIFLIIITVSILALTYIYNNYKKKNRK